MANYPDPPGQRMALDLDGTTINFYDDSNVLTTFTTQNIKDLIDESDSTLFQKNFTGGKVAIIFPELRDVTHMYLRIQPDGQLNVGTPPTFEKSVNTTTGLDGTWTAWSGATYDTGSPVVPRYRTQINAAAASGVIAVRYSYLHTGGNNGTQNKCLHLYGGISSGANPDRLALWHPTLDQALVAPALDFGDKARGSTTTISFRVKNLSATKTANTITISNDALTDASPTILSQLGLSSNGGSSYASTASAGSLAPGAISAVMMQRLVLAANAVIGLTSPRIIAAAASWT